MSGHIFTLAISKDLQLYLKQDDIGEIIASCNIMLPLDWIEHENSSALGLRP